MLASRTGSTGPTAWILPFLSLITTAMSETAPKYQPQPYTVNISAKFLENTWAKVGDFRNSADINAPPWFDGPPGSDIASIAKHWAEEYDWSATQAEINANFSHFYTTVPPPSANYNESVDLHFIHQRSEREDAIPIIFLHGWPSTSLEWQNVIPGLVKPDNENQPAFHVVAPDLPGFGFSPALTGSRVNFGRKEYGAVFASLMEQLGYDKYVLYSTDLGTGIAMSLIVDYKDHIINHVSDFLLTFVTPADQARFDANQTTPEETAYINSSNSFFDQHSGYSHMHRTYPLTLAYALNDSPVGFLAWIYHLGQSGSDYQLSPDYLITETLMLSLQGVYSTIRAYKELFTPTIFIPDVPFTVPTSVLQFGGWSHYAELSGMTYTPRDWVERTANVTYFARQSTGGHFPAYFEPDVVVGHIRKIFS
ncbi:alpha/beta-hydrolase [Polyplosphaeria fusca]|uniref:Alpha/beta-hydrolase n=1 Tax=Polyplosphaeria fusca TaxID=682080 RepID=A0A9P4QST4_9PLEO|nr:alpha/beta-hydrolase [Polyplosphaeria fusca]